MSEFKQVIALLEKPQTEWTKEDLTSALMATLAQYQAAMSGWGEVLEHCEAFKSANAQLRKENALLLQAIASTDQRAGTAKQSRGRPAKHKDLKWLHDWYIEATKTYGALSDMKLITAYFKDQYKALGMREGRVSSEAFISKAGTLRQLLVAARRQEKR